MVKDSASSHTLGRSGEEIALRYLKKKNFRIVAQGFRFRRGEIDIIAYDRNTLVFIEVKTRSSREFGPPEESVTPSKQRQIRKMAQGFLALHHIKDVECRFDVLSLMKRGENEYSVLHIKNAF